MKLEPFLNLHTSGARCVKLFTIDEHLYLAIPQLAEDLPQWPANMNGGNSDTHTNIFIWRDNQWKLFQQLPVHGGEHVDFAIIDDTPMLAIANIRQGQQPKFNMHTSSQIFSWSNQSFNPLQTIATNAAKSTCLFKIGTNNFLGISEGVTESDDDNIKDENSHLFLWDGNEFAPYQALPGIWGYDMTSFCLDEKPCLALADNSCQSTIYIWRENQFQVLQHFAPCGGGRHFCYFSIAGKHYLAFASLLHESHLYQWDGKRFQILQTFEGYGGRHFHFQSIHGEFYLFRTNFITGTRQAPINKQTSQVYHWTGSQFDPVSTYTTYGGTASETFEVHGQYYLAVANSLTEKSRFRVDSVIYKILL